METFKGKYNNDHEEAEIFIRGNGLIYKQYGHETKLLRISETDFLPEKNPSFKLSLNGNQASRLSIDGNEYFLHTKQPLLEIQLQDDTLTTVVNTSSSSPKTTTQYRETLTKMKQPQADTPETDQNKTSNPLLIKPKPSWEA